MARRCVNMANQNSVKPKPKRKGIFKRIGGGIQNVAKGTPGFLKDTYGDFDGNIFQDAKTVLRGAGDLATGGNLLTNRLKIKAANAAKNKIKDSAKRIIYSDTPAPRPSQGTVDSHNSAVNATRGSVRDARTTNPMMATHNDPNPLPGMKNVFSDLKNKSQKIKESDLAQAYKSINSKINLKELVNQPDQAIKGFIKEFGIPETVKQLKARFKKPVPSVENKKKGGMMKKKGYAKGGIAKKTSTKKTPVKKTATRRKVRGVGAATRGYGKAMR